MQECGKHVVKVNAADVAWKSPGLCIYKSPRWVVSRRQNQPGIALSECPFWVISGRSPQYYRNVRFRGQSGRSDTIYQAVDRECPVSPEAVIQIRRLGRF